MVLVNRAKLVQEDAHVAHCAREQQFIVYLKLCSRVAARLPRRWLLCTSIHFSLLSFSSPFLVYIKDIPARFRRYRYKAESVDDWQLNREEQK